SMRKPLFAAVTSAASNGCLLCMDPRMDTVNRPQLSLACYHRLAFASRFGIRGDTGLCTFLSPGPFDRLLVKCYKSSFCAAQAPAFGGCFNGLVWGTSGPGN